MTSLVAPATPHRAVRTDLHRLTSLRAVAAGLVVVHHGTLSLAAVPLVSPVAALGYVGVTFFFVLSGFVLTWSMTPDLRARHFYGRRFARIYPTHLVTLLIAVALAGLFALPASVAAIGGAVTLTQSWIPISSVTEQLNNVSWSLSDEAFFYALFPFVFWRWSRHSNHRLLRHIGVVAVLMLVACAVVHELFSAEVAGNILYKLPLFRVGEFLVGVALAIMVRNGWRPPFGMRVAGTLAVGWYAALVVALDATGHLNVIRVIPDLLMLPVLALLVVAAASADLADADARAVSGVRGRRPWLVSPTMVLLGRASFQLYMTHFLLLMVLQRLPTPSGPWLAPALIGYVMLSVAVSLVTYQLFEVPTERFLRRRLGGTVRPRAEVRDP